MATGSSTNAVLHYLAIAHAAGVKWTIDEFERVRRKVLVLCDLKPSSRHVATDFRAAGGMPQVLKMLLVNGVLRGGCVTIYGKTIADMLRGVPHEPRQDQDVIRPWADPMYRQGHLAIPKGNLSPEGCVAKITGLKQISITGPVRVFNSEPECLKAIMIKKIKRRCDCHSLRRAEGRARHAGDAGVDLRLDRPGAWRIRGAAYRRTLFRRHLGHGPRARGAGSL
jgi:dihydroxy-acid dehydratase